VAAENAPTRVLRPLLATAADLPGAPAPASVPGAEAPAPANRPGAEASAAEASAAPVAPATVGGSGAEPAGPRPVESATDGPAPAALADLVRAGRRVALARQVHNDLVRDALALRRRRLVRLLRLARKHPVPAYFDIDDPAPGRA
jgi:hypothetical protein